MLGKQNVPEWVDLAKEYPLGFAQVREDPLLDDWAINQLNVTGARIIMVASGGCTASLLATKKNIHSMTIVDPNKSQLALCQLKLMLLKHYTPEKRLALLGHSAMPINERHVQIERLLIKAGYTKDELGNLNQVAKLGLDFVGRYECLFSELQKELAAWQQEKTDVTQLENAFRKVMSIENLVSLFGNEATQNPVLPFWKHFFQQTYAALKSDLQLHNPFLSQLLLGKFSGAIYPWLMQEKQEINKSIHYINKPIDEALKESVNYYDFIHLSNVLDWLSATQAQDLLNIAADKLSPNGLLIIRQLNSSLDISSLGAPIKWLGKEADKLLKQDRSFFYKKIYLGRRL